MHDGKPLAYCFNADYCLDKLNNAYDAGDGSPALDSDSPLISRELPDGTRVKGVTFDADSSGATPTPPSPEQLRARAHADHRAQFERDGKNPAPGHERHG